jgi:hypothetical protein
MPDDVLEPDRKPGVADDLELATWLELVLWLWEGMHLWRWIGRELESKLEPGQGPAH